MRCHVGAITKSVRNRARPTSTWFGGICCVPIALRTKLRTIVMRTKLVTIIKMAGTRLRIVSRRKNCSAVALSEPAPPTPHLTPGGLVPAGAPELDLDTRSIDARPTRGSRTARATDQRQAGERQRQDDRALQPL